jgi:tetratricopeptide (TPR) repeat protein
MEPITASFAKFKEEIFLVQADIKSAFYERAMNKLEELILRNPERAEPYCELGKIAYSLRRNDEAERNYLLALQTDRDYFPTYIQYVLILIRESRFDEAVALLEKAKTIRHREDADIYFHLGLMHQHQGALDQAIAQYTRAAHYSITEGQLELSLKFIRACKELRDLAQ